MRKDHSLVIFIEKDHCFPILLWLALSSCVLSLNSFCLHFEWCCFCSWLTGNAITHKRYSSKALRNANVKEKDCVILCCDCSFCRLNMTIESRYLEIYELLFSLSEQLWSSRVRRFVHEILPVLNVKIFFFWNRCVVFYLAYVKDWADISWDWRSHHGRLAINGYVVYHWKKLAINASTGVKSRTWILVG